MWKRVGLVVLVVFAMVGAWRVYLRSATESGPTAKLTVNRSEGEDNSAYEARVATALNNACAQVGTRGRIDLVVMNRGGSFERTYLCSRSPFPVPPTAPPTTFDINKAFGDAFGR